MNAHPTAGLSDAQLAHAIASGNRHAFRALVRRYDVLLHRTARRILRNDPDVDDAVQSAYLLAYRGIRNFRRDSKLSTWLVRIVINEALGCLRKRSQTAHVVHMADRELDAAIESHADASSQHQETPERLLMRSDLSRRIQACIERLPVSHRAVFVLRACEELSVREAAAALHIPEATVRTRFFRARRQLRRSLAAEKDDAARGLTQEARVLNQGDGAGAAETPGTRPVATLSIRLGRIDQAQSERFARSDKPEAIAR